MVPIAAIPEDIIPLFAIIAVLMVPIVRILSKHQQQMAMILRQPHDTTDPALAQLSTEVRELRSMIAQQSIALDNLRDENRALRSSNERNVSA